MFASASRRDGDEAGCRVLDHMRLPGSPPRAAGDTASLPTSPPRPPFAASLPTSPPRPPFAAPLHGGVILSTTSPLPPLLPTPPLPGKLPLLQQAGAHAKPASQAPLTKSEEGARAPQLGAPVRRPRHGQRRRRASTPEGTTAASSPDTAFRDLVLQSYFCSVAAAFPSLVHFAP